MLVLNLNKSWHKRDILHWESTGIKKSTGKSCYISASSFRITLFSFLEWSSTSWSSRCYWPLQLQLRQLGPRRHKVQMRVLLCAVHIGLFVFLLVQVAWIPVKKNIGNANALSDVETDKRESQRMITVSVWKDMDLTDSVFSRQDEQCEIVRVFSFQGISINCTFVKSLFSDVKLCWKSKIKTREDLPSFN